ncbi:MAG: hypothetical protein ACOX41_03235 [Anaerovoracaceae bacterium]|jgi:hypothetical protein
MEKKEVQEQVKKMMEADSCCQESKDACQKYLDAAGTAGGAILDNRGALPGE